MRLSNSLGRSKTQSLYFQFANWTNLTFHQNVRLFSLKNLVYFRPYTVLTETRHVTEWTTIAITLTKAPPQLSKHQYRQSNRAKLLFECYQSTQVGHLRYILCAKGRFFIKALVSGISII